ncbi:MAG: hypothetical protein CL609_04965 [Anaerolineaceae bacterium]|nr:hypothetical protein [Anaerolineaceae bacterium]
MNPTIFEKTVSTIQKRYLENQNATLQQVYDLDTTFTFPQQWEIDFSYKYRKEISEILDLPEYFDQFVQLFLESTLRFTVEHNQFISLTTQNIDDLKTLYQKYVASIRDFLHQETSYFVFKTHYQFLLLQHFNDLHHQLKNITPEPIRPALLNVNVVCAEYDPKLQLEIMNINLKKIKQPVLDIGCGAAANLIHYLTELGISCLGIDQLCKNTVNTQKIDWFTFSTQPNTWAQSFPTWLSAIIFNLTILIPVGIRINLPLSTKNILIP